MCVYNFDVAVSVCGDVVKRIQRDLRRDNALTMSSDATMERVLNCDCDVTVNTIVLTAPTSSIAVSQSVYSLKSVLC